MAKHHVVTTDNEIDAAWWRAKLRRDELLAQTVEHIPGLNLLIVGLSNHRRLVLPIEDLQDLGDATHEQLQNVPALIEGVYGNRRWMAQLGSRGGKARTEAKRKAARTNGAKGGRPARPLATKA
jgi:hypothetical protein